MQGPDPRDPVCASRPPEPAMPSLDAEHGSLRVGIAGGYFAAGATRPCTTRSRRSPVHSAPAPDRNSRRGARAPGRLLITATEGGRLHLDRLESSAGRFRSRDSRPLHRWCAVAVRLVPAGTTVPQLVARLRCASFPRGGRLFAPATPVPATMIGQETMTLGGLEMAVRPNLGIFTQPISFVGLPVVAAPVHRGRPHADRGATRSARPGRKPCCCASPVCWKNRRLRRACGPLA